MNHYFYILLITILPAIELRGSIPVGIALGMSPLAVFLAATVANILLIFPIFFLLDKVFPHLRKIDRLGKIIGRIHNKTEPYVKKYGTLGLLLFVAIPLPGSGAYSGSLAAYLFNIERKKAIPAIAGGVLIAGIGVTLAAMGAVSALHFFL